MIGEKIAAVLYSREDCHLCEQALEDLEALREQFEFELVVVDVDSDKKLQREYGFEVPVVKVDPYTLKAPFTRQDLQMTISAALDRQRHIEMIENSPQMEALRRGESWTGSDGFTYWISRHYMLVFNLFVALYVGLAFLAPVLMKAGAQTPANLVYRAYSVVCHQLAYRSIFLFGEQPFYPRAEAQVEGLITYNQATGMGEGSGVEDVFAARRFVGNEVMGYKVALCQRDVAIYLAILAFGILFSLTGKRLPPLPWYLWLMLGILPIALDGLSQLFSQPPFNLGGFRESTPFYRILTGAMFGFFTAWFGYPLVEETMVDTRQVMGDKLRRIKRAVAGD
jgi:uncharacterized membrane protein